MNLTRIDVSNKKQNMDFPNITPTFYLMKIIFLHMQLKFKEIATVAIDFSIKDTNNQDEFALKYF